MVNKSRMKTHVLDIDLEKCGVQLFGGWYLYKEYTIHINSEYI